MQTEEESYKHSLKDLFQHLSHDPSDDATKTKRLEKRR